MAQNAQQPSHDLQPPSYSRRATPGDTDAYDQAVIPAQTHSDDEARSCMLVFLLYALIARLRVAENAPPRIVAHDNNEQHALDNLASIFPVDGLPSPLPILPGTEATGPTSRAHPRGLIDGLGVDGNLGLPPPYALSINETTWSFLTDLLELRVSLAVYSPSAGGINVPTTIIDEHGLRALYMQAITWYIDRECIPLSGAQVAFIGRRVGEDVNTQYPCLPIADVREIAEQLPLDGVSITALANFDPFMFCAGEFFPDVCSYWCLFFLVFFCVVVSGAFAFFIAHVFLVVWPVVTWVVGDDTIRFAMKVVFKIFAAFDAFENYVLHVGVAILGFVEFAFHFAN